MTTPFFITLFAILRKDMRAELRSRELINAMVLFTLLSILIFSFALELNRTAEREVVGGVLWVTITYASILGLNRSLAGERDQANMDAMLLAPTSRIAIYLGKMIGNFLFTMLVGILLLPIMTVLFTFNLVRPLMLLLLALGIFGLTSIGTLLAAMTVQTRARETLLPIAMMPMILPILLVVVRASSQIIGDDSRLFWIVTLLAIDVIYVILGCILFEYVVED